MDSRFKWEVSINREYIIPGKVTPDLEWCIDRLGYINSMQDKWDIKFYRNIYIFCFRDESDYVEFCLRWG